MPKIKFPNLRGEVPNKLTIESDSEGKRYQLNGHEIPNVLNVRLALLDGVPRVEISMVVSEIESDFMPIEIERD